MIFSSIDMCDEITDLKEYIAQARVLLDHLRSKQSGTLPPSDCGGGVKTTHPALVSELEGSLITTLSAALADAEGKLLEKLWS